MRLQEGLIRNIMTLTLKKQLLRYLKLTSGETGLDSSISKWYKYHHHTVVQIKMAFATAVSDSIPRSTAGGKGKSDTSKNVQKPHITATCDRAAPPVPQLPVGPTPLLFHEWKNLDSIRQVVFWTLHSYLAYPLCLIKKDATKTMSGKGSGCQAGAVGAVTALGTTLSCGNHSRSSICPARIHFRETALSLLTGGDSGRQSPLPPPAKAAALRSF